MSGLAGGASRRTTALHPWSCCVGCPAGLRDRSVLYDTNARDSPDVGNTEEGKSRKKRWGRRRNVFAGLGVLTFSGTPCEEVPLTGLAVLPALLPDVLFAFFVLARSLGAMLTSVLFVRRNAFPVDGWRDTVHIPLANGAK